MKTILGLCLGLLLIISTVYSQPKYPETYIIDGDTVTVMTFMAAKMYAKKYEELDLCQDELSHLNMAVSRAVEMDSVNRLGIDSLKASLVDCHRSGDQKDIALEKEEEMHQVTKDKSKKKDKAIVGLALLAIVFLLI